MKKKKKKFNKKTPFNNYVEMPLNVFITVVLILGLKVGNPLNNKNKKKKKIINNINKNNNKTSMCLCSMLASYK